MRTVSVLGLGRVGLPTAALLAAHGHRVMGVDTDPGIVESLKQGRIQSDEPGFSALLGKAISSGRLTFGIAASPADVFLIAVPTPCCRAAGSFPSADLSLARAAVESILPHLGKGNLVIIESTVPPGTTRDVLIPMIEAKGWKVGEDIGVAYCPERMLPGKAIEELCGNDRIVGAVSPFWSQEAESFYRSFVSGAILHTTPIVAEMVKIVENTYRDVNIALANEVSVLCEKLGIDAWRVIEYANRHPRVHMHLPGPGVGGHCIGVDPWFLLDMFRNDAPLIHLSRRINEERPRRVADQILSLLGCREETKVALLGLSYKEDVGDTRGSPTLCILDILRRDAPWLEVAVVDPFGGTREIPVLPIEEAVEGADLAVILVAHEPFLRLDPRDLGAWMRRKAVLDTRNVLDRAAWRSAGFRVEVLGAGEGPIPAA